MIAGLSSASWLRRNPPHPGRQIAVRMEPADDYSGLTVAEAARKLGISRGHLSRVINGRAAVSLALAMKLDALGWGTAEGWVRAQTRYDIAQERKRLNRPLTQSPAYVREQELRRAEVQAAEAA